VPHFHAIKPPTPLPELSSFCTGDNPEDGEMYLMVVVPAPITRVVLDKVHRAVKWLCVCVCELASCLVSSLCRSVKIEITQKHFSFRGGGALLPAPSPGIDPGPSGG